ncbi:50S ribosomal protein L5 [Patescibacteria group bacterium]|nr:50S ribosomal protein L5 [Patescibacteria group bacterium]MBU1629834.1 50S ribosomal protein L5 [Patescibacteria group bacterium]
MSLKENYQKNIVPRLSKEFDIKNKMAVPNVKAITLSVGMSAGIKDPKLFEVAENVLMRITGQRPVKTKAKQSIANFKLRKGMVVGLRVTLRGKRMWDFLEKLLTLTFARVRDFRGISVKQIDSRGNISIGFREFLPFPEIKPDEVERVHGVEVTVSTTAGSKERGLTLLKALGFPFRD